MHSRISRLGLVLAPLAGAGCFDFSQTQDGSSMDGGSGGNAGSFCARMAPPSPTPGSYYCDDFDTGNFQAFWAPEQSQGSVAVDSVVSDSPPFSMAANSSEVMSGSPPRAVVKLGFPNFANSHVNIDVSFDMNVEKIDPTTSPPGKVIAFQLLYGPVDPNNFNQIAFNLVTNSAGDGVVAQVEENAPSPDGGDGYNLIGPFVVYPKVNGWTHVEIAIDILDPVGPGNTISVSLDGQTNQNALAVPLKGQQPRIELGIAGTPIPALPWSIRYDNFVAKLQ